MLAVRRGNDLQRGLAGGRGHGHLISPTRSPSGRTWAAGSACVDCRLGALARAVIAVVPPVVDHRLPGAPAGGPRHVVLEATPPPARRGSPSPATACAGGCSASPGACRCAAVNRRGRPAGRRGPSPTSPTSPAWLHRWTQRSLVARLTRNHALGSPWDARPSPTGSPGTGAPAGRHHPPAEPRPAPPPHPWPSRPYVGMIRCVPSTLPSHSCLLQPLVEAM